MLVKTPNDEERPGMSRRNDSPASPFLFALIVIPRYSPAGLVCTKSLLQVTLSFPPGVVTDYLESLIPKWRRSISNVPSTRKKSKTLASMFTRMKFTVDEEGVE